MKAEASKERAISKKIFVTFIGSVGVTLLLVFAWIYLYFSLQSRAEAVLKIKQQNNRISQIVSHLSELKLQSQKASKILPGLYTLLPSEEEALFVVSDLETIAKDIGVNQVFTLGQVLPPSGDVPRSIGFSLLLNGRLEQFFSYLRRIESLPYSIQLSNVNLSDDDGDGVLQINAVGKLFVR